MNTPITNEHLDALMQSTEYIRNAVARAREAEGLNTIIGNAEKAFGEHYHVLKHQPLARQVDHILSRLGRFRELMMENDKLKIDLAQARRENETLALQVPPLPEQTMAFVDPAFNTQPTYITVEPGAFTKVLGQAWCCVDGKPLSNKHLNIYQTHGGYFSLCNVHQDVITCALTYVPISFDDLPCVTEATAS